MSYGPAGLQCLIRGLPSAVIFATALAATAQSASERSSSLYFPPAAGGWEQVSPADAGWNDEKMRAALDYAGKTHASGVVILYRGRLLAERYWTPDRDHVGKKGREYSLLVHGRNAAGQVIEDVASVQKSVAAL